MRIFTFINFLRFYSFILNGKSFAILLFLINILPSDLVSFSLFVLFYRFYYNFLQSSISIHLYIGKVRQGVGTWEYLRYLDLNLRIFWYLNLTLDIFGYIDPKSLNFTILEPQILSFYS